MFQSLYSILTDKLNFSEEYYHRLLEITELRTFSNKEYLLKIGKTCNFIGFVEKGYLRSFREKDGEQFISEFYVHGSFISSYRSFLNQEPSAGAIQALENSEILYLTFPNYNLLLQENSEWYKLGKYIADILFIKKCIKETSLLMDSASDRYKLLLKTYPDIEQHVAQYHIASYLGIKPESLSRIKSLNIGH